MSQLIHNAAGTQIRLDTPGRLPAIRLLTSGGCREHVTVVAVVRASGHRRCRVGVGLSHHAYLYQPVEIWIDLFGQVGCKSVLLIEASSPRVLLGDPELCRPLAESVVKESLTDPLAVAAGQHVERVQLLLPLRRVPLVLDGRTARDKPHDPGVPPGDVNALPGITSDSRSDHITRRRSRAASS